MVVSMKIFRFLSIIILSVLYTYVFGQHNQLKKTITINVTNISLQDALTLIGEKANFNFSYNSDILDNSKVISLNMKNSTVESALNEILGKNVDYKVVGNHIVILRNDKAKNKKSNNNNYIISGYIIDSSTGHKIRSATVYEIDGTITCMTDSVGHYSISIPENKEFLGLLYCKKGYLDTVIIVNPVIVKSVNIHLTPKIKPVDKIPVKEAAIIADPFENQTIVNWVVPSEVLTNSTNMSFYEKRFGQVSFLPLPGVRTYINGAIVNKLSLNVLAGFSDGVEGVEVGSVLNIDRSYVKGLQIAGFGNIVGKKTNGVQISGFFNINTGSVTGVQVAGFNNIVNDTITGVQISGFTNILKGKMRGVQVAGFYNHTTKDADGVQIAGFMNYTKIDNKGAQISGFLNKTKTNKCLQIGFINMADTSSGYSIGFFNYVKKGYRAIELSTDEVFYGNLSFKSGTKRLYNIYSLGVRSVGDTIWYAGVGLGTYFNLGKKFSASLELMSNSVNEKMLWQDQLNLLNKFSISLDYKITPGFVIYATPTYNVHVSSSKDLETNSFKTEIAPNPFFEESTSTTQTQMWIGWKAGIRIIFCRN